MQRRALDTARAKLATLTHRTAVVDLFFQHACTLFELGVLFLVRGDLAQGHAAHGLGLPEGLIDRIAVPLDQPGILVRARELRRPFIGVTKLSEADAELFGKLGRTMPGGVVVPLVVRDRVVALFLGDRPAEPLRLRAREIGRSESELAKDEMLLWAESVGEALEALIRQTKARTASSRPPSISPFGSVPPPALGSLPPAPRVPRDLGLPSSAEGVESETAAPPPPPIPAPKRTLGGGSAAAIGLVIVALAATAAVAKQRMDHAASGADAVVAAGTELAGWPSAIDPAKGIAVARRAAGLGEDAELASIRAEIGKDGTVDLGGPAAADAVDRLAYVFVDPTSEIEVRVDRRGVLAPRVEARTTCSEQACRPSVPEPRCSFAKIREVAATLGLRDEDVPVVTYGVEPGGEPSAARWTVAVRGRGQARLDVECKPLPRERIRPPARPLSSVPGAPNRVDPLAAEGAAREQAGLEPDAVLAEIEAKGVGTDGTVAFSAEGDAAVTYTFADPDAAAGSNVRRWRRVVLDKEGFQVVADESERGPLPPEYDPMLAPPRCGFGSAFTYMTLEGPPVARAVVAYRSDVVSHQGRWSLSLPGGGARPSISDLECEAWASVHEAAATPPRGASDAGRAKRR